MTTVTLEQLTARQDELAKLIQQFTAQQPREITIDETTISLAQGEHYAGIVLLADGTPSHHLVLLPGAAEDITFEQTDEAPAARIQSDDAASPLSEATS